MRYGLLGASAVLTIFLLALPRPCRADDAAGGEAPREVVRPPSYRFAFTPTWTHAFVARSVSHQAIGAAPEVFLSRRIGIALVGALYAPFDQDASPSDGRRTETLGSVLPEVRIALFRDDR